jgi:hypothetical protein
MNELEKGGRMKLHPMDPRSLDQRASEEGYKQLLTRAADALEEEFGAPNDPAYGVRGPVHELIAELRKAAG